MALSPATVDQHIARWQVELDGGYQPHRKHWPSRLFHHAPLENAVRILKSGCIRSRNDPLNGKVRDVAAPEVIANQTHAHDLVRLYFRPRTPTQFHIEGIRKDNECEYGNKAHAPVLIMFVLKCRETLLAEGVKFSDRNMQINYAQTGDDEAFFATIPFEKVFHEGGIGGDRSIIAHRCAEVLAPSPLTITDKLQWIYCRSEAERTTLLYFLGDKAKDWRRITRVSDDLRVFDKRFAFFEHVNLSKDGITFQINSRHDRQKVAVTLELWDSQGNQVLSFRHLDHDTVPAKATRWIYRHPLPDGSYLLRGTLEGHLAFEGRLKVADELI